MATKLGATSDPTASLADFAAALRYEDLPGPVVAALKRLILETLGVTLAATTLGPGCREALAVMRGLGGAPEATILGTSAKVSAPNAAFANGALAHALNYDPIGAEVGHVGVVCLAAPLAVAESAGGVSGRSFLAASAVACEVTARVTAAIAIRGRHPGGRFLAGQLLSYFGAALGAGRVLGLGAAAMRDALGLALMQAAGSMQVVLAGDPPAKAIYGAFPNQAGVLAALLSKAGLGADCDALAGPAGLFGLFYDGAYDAAALAGGLGSDYLLLQTQPKLWPTSLHAFPFIEAAIEIAGQGARAAEIEAVVIRGPSALRAWCEPAEKRHRPENAAAAGNSIPFCAAKALAHGGLTLADLTGEGLADPAAIALARRSRFIADDSIAGGVLAVEAAGGRRLEAHVERPLGDPARPVGYERLVEKFRDCCHHAATPLSPAAVQGLIELIQTLEDVDDVARLPALASGG